MTPGKYPLWIYRGDTYYFMWQLWNDDHRMYPVNLLNATAKAEIRDEPGGTLRASMDCYIVGPNMIVGMLSATESEKLTEPEGYWDLQLNHTGIVNTIIRGTVTVESDVTDSRRIDQPVTARARGTGLLPFPKRGARAA